MPTVKQRARPTRELVRELTGCNEWLLSSMRHGLVETPLYDFYPNLNLSEALMFAAASFERRRSNSDHVRRDIEPLDAHELFRWAYGKPVYVNERQEQDRRYKNPFQWLNTHKSSKLNGISHTPLEERAEEEIRSMDSLQRKYARLNPYNPLTLRERLADTPELTLLALKDNLGKRTKWYVSKGKLPYILRNPRLSDEAKNRAVAMDFQPPDFTGKGRQIARRYVEELVRLLADYSQCYLPLPKTDS